MNWMDSKVLRRWLPLSLVFILGCGPKPQVGEDLVWPPAPETPRIRYLRAISSKSDLNLGKLSRLKKSLTGEEALERIGKPYGVAVDARGRLFVSDAGNASVLVFNEQPRKGEEPFAYLGREGNGKLVEPAGLAIDDSGNIYVGDVQQNQVFCYGPDLHFQRTYGVRGEFTRPAGIAFNVATQELVILDSKSHTVKFFDKAGKLLRTIGEKGSEAGQFNIPTQVVCDAQGRVYIVDSMNFRVQIFSPQGEYLSTFGQADNVPGSFTRPKGIALDSEGHIYVSDAAFDNIQIFQPDGTLLLFFGGAGKDPGSFQLPAGMCFDGQDRLYIADQYNRRVQIFQYIRQDRTN